MCNLSEGIYEDGKAAGIIQGKAEGRAEGRAEGEANGISIYATLTKKLLSLGRISDIEKAADDKDFRDKLLKEFAIQ